MVIVMNHAGAASGVFVTASPLILGAKIAITIGSDFFVNEMHIDLSPGCFASPENVSGIAVLITKFSESQNSMFLQKVQGLKQAVLKKNRLKP